MANFDQLKQSVAALIRTNGAEEITGQIMQDVLLTIINSISGGYMFGGVAQHNGNVGNPDYNVFYLAGSGAYTGYGGAITIEAGCYGVFRYNGVWTQEVVDIGVRLSGSIVAGETRGVTGDTINTALQTLFDNVMNILDTLTFTYNTPSAQQATKAMLDVIMTPMGGAPHVLTTLTLVSATAAAAGLMSAEDKQKVDRMLTDFRSLSFSDTTAVSDQATKIVQTLSATLGENPEAITTMTFLAATTSKAGLLSAADKAKLDALWSSGYQFAGIATPSTTPISTTSKIFYIATEAGTYFNAVTVTQGINILSWNGSAWSAVQVVGIDDEPTPTSGNLVTSNAAALTEMFARTLYPSVPYIINGYACSFDSGGNFTSYQEASAFSVVWIAVRPETEKIIVKNGDERINPRLIFFSDYSPISDNYIGNSHGNTVPEGTKLVIINLLNESYPSGYDSISVELSDDYVNDIKFRKGVKYCCDGIYFDANHVVSITEGIISYYYTAEWDCLWIPLQSEWKSINVEGTGENKTYRFFDSYNEITTETYLGGNKTGVIPAGAKVCIINLQKTRYSSYDFKLNVVTDSVLHREIGTMFPGAIAKNYINKDDLLTGYILNGGKIEPLASGVMSNKIVFENNTTYAFQNLWHYGNKHKIYICHFDENDEFLGQTNVAAIYEEGSHVGNAIYRYSAASWQGTAYCRIVLRTNSTSVDFSLCQVEKGDEYTEIVGYNEVVAVTNNENAQAIKTIKLLSIGNSYSQDALAYVPFIMQNMGADVDYQIGILMKSSATLDGHIENFLNEAEVYTFYMYNGGTSWQNLGLRSIQWALDNYDWDLVSLQQSSQSAYNWSTYQPACNRLVNLIGAYVDQTIKFIWYQPYARPARTNSGANYSDDVITEHYENTAGASLKLFDETAMEYVVPVGTAVQNARTISSIKAMGAYSTNQYNTSGLGYCACVDGVHLQEGLPCQIAAYTFIMSLLDIYGFDNISILGETTRVTSDWAQGKAIPGPHGEYIGSTDENCLIAQLSVIMAMKKKFEVTDMNYIINPT